MTWVQLGTNFNASNNAWNTTVFLGTVISVSTQTVTINFSSAPGADLVGYALQEFSSSTGIPTLDIQGDIDATPPSGGTNTWASLVPASAGELYFGYAQNNSSAISGSTPGYIYVPNSDQHTNGMAYNVNCTSSAQAPVWGDSTQIVGVMVLLKAPAGGGAAPGITQRAPRYSVTLTSNAGWRGAGQSR
jgi:hypothetical protein